MSTTQKIQGKYQLQGIVQQRRHIYNNNQKANNIHFRGIPLITQLLSGYTKNNSSRSF
jgi:hypothetical protein